MTFETNSCAPCKATKALRNIVLVRVNQALAIDKLNNWFYWHCARLHSLGRDAVKMNNMSRHENGYLSSQTMRW